MNDYSLHEKLLDLELGQLTQEESQQLREQILTDEMVATAYNRCQQWLAPLALANAPITVPRGLTLQTLARIAEVMVDEQRRDPAPSVTLKALEVGSPAPSRLRSLAERASILRLDWVIAASIVFVISGLFLGGLGKLRQEQTELACKEELRSLHVALVGYADTHQGRLPEVGTAILPRPGVLAETLVNHGQFLARDRLACPTVPGEVSQVSYAYTLGYRSHEMKPVQGIVLGATHLSEMTPIAADLSPLLSASLGTRSHPGGQNVLLLGGSVTCVRGNLYGTKQDDIYQNSSGFVRAGLRIDDYSLGGPNDLP